MGDTAAAVQDADVPPVVSYEINVAFSMARPRTFPANLQCHGVSYTYAKYQRAEARRSHVAQVPSLLYKQSLGDHSRRDDRSS